MMGNFSNNTGFAWNNIYRLMQGLASHLDSIGIDSYISFPTLSQPISREFEVFRHHFRLSPNSLKISDLREMRRVIRDNSIRTLYLTDQKTTHPAYLFYRMFGIKRIIVHNRVSVASPDPSVKDAGLRPALKWLWSRVPGFSCDKVYAVSNFVKDRLVNKGRVPQSKIQVILNGVDTEKFKPHKTLNSVREAIPEDQKIKIFCGGRANRYKGFQHVFEAVRVIVEEKEAKNIIVDYAGDGPDLATMKRFVRENGLDPYINFHGQLSSTERLQTEADIIVVPSCWGDACPSTVAEALAAGKPLIATTAGGIPEMIGSKHNAIMVPYENPRAIAEALETLRSNPEYRDKLSVNARTRAVQALSLQRYHQDVIDNFVRDMKVSGSLVLET